MLVTRKFTFDSAHYLTDYYGKCERIHGHTYKLEVTLEGNVQSNGLVIDFVLLKRIVQKNVLAKLDHQNLNDIIENPTAERVVMWIWEQLKDIQKLLQEEIKDSNVLKDINIYFEEPLPLEYFQKVKFDTSLRLFELKLSETENSFITYQGREKI